ncbi:MAG: methionyl-tRNA formyltransferase [Gammaproteobacteria bacterium]|jgi:methionyl-tRNA formyltransferase
MTATRYVFLGCEAHLSRAVFNALSPWWAPAAVVLGGALAPERPEIALPVDAPMGFVGTVRKHGLPILSIRDDAANAYRLVHGLRPDVLVMACFPHILNASWLALPRLGVLNVHPSLLPRYRGPAPLYWQRQHGALCTGATVHWASAKPDAGPIVAQASYPADWSCTDEALTEQHGAVAGSLLRAILAPLRVGRGTVASGRGQPTYGVSTLGWPPGMV